MDKSKKEKDVLTEIFNNDPQNILIVKKSKTEAQSSNELLVSKFNEINDFYREHGKEPEKNMSSILEYKLYSRLLELKNSLEKSDYLQQHDEYGLLNV